LVAGSTFLESEAFASAAQTTAPSDRVRFAMVGVGMEGSGLLTTAVQLPGVECVAAADLYDGRHELATEIVGKPIKTTRRYQELLDDKGIDAIIVAVPIPAIFPTVDAAKSRHAFRNFIDTQHELHAVPSIASTAPAAAWRAPGAIASRVPETLWRLHNYPVGRSAAADVGPSGD
jgi:threonine dehydrogenase-like Zn-dependent dehydrogenase